MMEKESLGSKRLGKKQKGRQDADIEQTDSFDGSDHVTFNECRQIAR